MIRRGTATTGRRKPATLAVLPLALGLSAVGSLGCGPEVTRRVRPAGETRPEDAWLDRIGHGPSQTARVCGSGAFDQVLSALCGEGAGGITGLAELYRALGLGEGDGRYVAATTHSLGLSARSVSAANPRSFVFAADRHPMAPERVVAAAFARGEPFVELVALDRDALDYNFYLLRFEPACGADPCTAEDLLTERVESGWTGFTLYADRDLVDTPLDCVSCHQPFGPGSRKQMLMRQTASPWLHWGDFRGHYESRICQEPREPAPGRFIPGDGLDLLVALEGETGRHAGIPIAELAASASGERFSLYLTEVENTVRAQDTSGYPYAQLGFDSTTVLCELLDQPVSPSWELARAESLALGQPVPYYAHDLLEVGVRDELLFDRDGYLARQAGQDPFEIAAGLIGEAVEVAVGFVPRSGDSAREILNSLCVRCHAANVDSGLGRAGFNAQALDAVSPETARKVRERIHQPRHSPELMPPRRFGELPPWAKERIDAFLSERCTVPGGCE